MNTKAFFTVLSIVICAGISFSQDRPNILWLTFEDTSPQYIGCYGDQDAQTPVMDKMSREGVRFTQAFSTGTVCSPSRSAIITGVPTYKLGSGHHRSSFPIPQEIKGFPEYLKDAGYYVTNNYKTDYNIADAKDFVARTWHENSGKAGWWNRQKDQPFFAVFNIPDSHQSRTMSMTYEWYEKNVLSFLKEEDKETKVTLENNNPPKEKRQINKEFSGLHQKEIIADTDFKMPPIYRDSDAMRKQMARVYNAIKLTDMKMGDLLQQLKNDGLLEETIVFIFADHGEGMPRAKTNGIGLGYRVPFIIWFPEKYQHLSPWGTGGVVSDELIDFKDLGPTVLNLAGVAIPEYMQGRALLDNKKIPEPAYTYLSSDRADNGPDLVRTITDGRYLYSRNFMPFFPEVKFIRYIDIGEITMQMHQDYKEGKLNELQQSLFQDRPIEVLYDLELDQWETKNLINDPAYSQLRSKMRDRLKSKVLSERDIHFLPEYELERISSYTTPYAFRLVHEQYALKEIFETATLVGKEDVSSINELLRCMESPNKIVRYWASLGLYGARDQLGSEVLRSLSKRLEDAYPPVQINLAALLYEKTNSPQAASKLQAYAAQKNEHLALSAINYMLYMQNRSAFTTTIQKVYNSKIGYKVKAAAEDFLSLEGKLPIAK